MEISDLVSARRFRELKTDQRQELYETLLQLIEVVEQIPKKSLRKTLDVTLAVLHWKGTELDELQTRVKDKGSSDDDSQMYRLIDENNKLKIMLEKLEDENTSLQQKGKELTEDIFQLQKRLQEVAEAAVVELSDKESSDPLSEMDKQGELLRNINTKNKHIRRLLRQIEALQDQNITQSKTIMACEAEVEQLKAKLLQLSADITLVDSERKALKENVNELNIEITRLESNITYLEEDREKGEHDLKEVTEKLEAKVQKWKIMHDEKEKELKKVRARLQKAVGTVECTESYTESGSTSKENTKLLQALETRDRHIELLESKIKALANEMISSTELMNKWSAEQEEARNPHKTRICCKTIEESLQSANERCRELSEMLARSEEDNALKSKQALQAIAALDAYERGDDGLVKSLRKCTTLEQKIISRDKQIRALIMELNSMHEIVNENSILRKRLNIPDDMVISAKNLIAKERSKDKMIERLTLKLRASEEMRLQLKLEKSELRKELIKLQQQKPQEAISQMGESDKISLNSLQTLSEIGEVKDNTHSTCTVESEARSFCVNCKLKLDIPDERNQMVTEREVKYQEVLEENDTLRAGMLEILEKLREYDASSDHITIDTEMLYRMLEALRTHSVPASPNRLQTELQTLKAREVALQALLYSGQNAAAPQETCQHTDQLDSVESIREAGELRRNDEDLLQQVHDGLDTSTRPTTPNKNLNQGNIPIIRDDDGPQNENDANLRALEEELSTLQVYRKHYEALQLQLNGSTDDNQRHCAELSAQTLQLELELKQQRSSYAFMRVDFDQTLSIAKQSELRHIAERAELQQQLHSLQVKLEAVQEQRKLHQSAGPSYTKDEYLLLQQANAELRAQLAEISDQLLAGKLDMQVQFADICTDYGIIQDNLQLEYITTQEYEQLQAELQDARKTREEANTKCAQLEGLLEVTQSQLQSQQKLLNDITDNHVNLRHLVADLQSDGEDKLLLAKMERDMESAKQELCNLRFEHEELQQRLSAAQRALSAKEQLCVQLNKDFHFERNNKDIKIKYLQKSLFVLREKYAKFTPLIFLTNYVFAYTKFMKNSLQSNQTNEAQNVLTEDVILMMQKKLEEQALPKDESEQLIKQIKTDMHCKLLEENLNSLQQRYQQIQEELLQQRVRYAQESEHWQTINALFQPDTTKAADISAPDDTFIKDMSASKHKDMATNTDAPVPAERKLSTPTPMRRKSLAEMVDRGLSPIGSPVKRQPKKADAAIQTTETEKMVHELAAQNKLNADKDSEVIAETMQEDQSAVKEASKMRSEKTVQVELPEVQKVTVEALVQTGTTVMMSQNVQTDPFEEPQLNTMITEKTTAGTTELEQQLHSMQQKADERDAVLEQCQQDLQAAQKRNDELLQQLKLAKKAAIEDTAAKDAAMDNKSKSENIEQKHDIIEKTIISFHTLLSEKDKSIGKYQHLLQSEREQSQMNNTKLHSEIESLRSTVSNLNFNVKTKDMEIFELKTHLETHTARLNSNEKLDLAMSTTAGVDDGVDNSLHELTDEKLEEMFQQDPVPTPVDTLPTATSPQMHIEKQNMERLKQLPLLQQQLKELQQKLRYCEQTMRVKDDEITLLKEKLQLYQEREKTLECTVNPEVEQLQTLLQEKDKHIDELTETLNNFHDDQQRYIKDSSSCSADQISKLHADLTRTEATNKIYHTQVEALRRQVASLTEREKQARELNQSLRNQLIKRPVVSIKTELNARVKNEHLQKRIHTLELELEEARAHIQRQQIMLDAKRAKSASEVGMWEKQKRWQQNAERFKAKYEETETTLEKTRGLLQSARTMISRLEKEKQVLEVKLNRAVHGGSGGNGSANTVLRNIKCCRTPSCPNLQHVCGGKYTPSESPETYTGGSSECSSPAHSLNGGGRHYYANAAVMCVGSLEKQQPHSDLMEALKARIELQQRKILAMELEGKGTNALTTELEKLQDKVSEIEAQNIRLEAKNLQLQLDNDLLRQGNATERLQKRIKYLEDYIIALKEEMAQAEARRELCKCSGIKITTQLGQSAEQTILSLRGIVEKLRVENKLLKDGRRSSESHSSTDAATTGELSKLQKMYSDSLAKISALQIELNVKAKCRTCGKAETHINDELTFIKEQLNKKTQLLQKAKVLLTRAAAKEKVLKEQLSLWKRKCSELQNVPVIDEISE